MQGLTWSFVYPCDWVTPTWLAINPAVDNEADAQAVRDGRMSYQEFCAKWGVDWRKQIRDREEVNKVLDQHGVVLDIDSRQRTRAGSAQPAAKQPGATNDNADADNALEEAENAEDADTGLQNGASLMNGAALHEPRGYLRKNGEADHDGRPFLH